MNRRSPVSHWIDRHEANGIEQLPDSRQSNPLFRKPPRRSIEVEPLLAASSSTAIEFPIQEHSHDRLMNAREVAACLGVSERWVRDHTTRRSPRIRAVKLGTLIRYRRADLEIFMESLATLHPSHKSRFGV
jgi:excisionase family DNA binding protein